MNEKEAQAITDALAPSTGKNRPGKGRHPNVQPTFRRGLMRDAILEGARNIGAGIHFRPRDAWDALSDATRSELMAGYEDPFRAKQRFIENVAKYSGGYVPGLRQVERHHGGESTFVWTPPSEVAKALNGSDVGAVLTFTVVGRTSDGMPVYRNDETGALGWVAWDEL